jgi:LuxR family transcriptional regulator, quorum-sensing system regulator BjaR1
MQEYRQENMADGDLLAERVVNSTASFDWRMSDWGPATLTPSQRRWYLHNLKHGLDGGLCILDFRHSENMVLVLCGPDGSMDPHDRKVLMFAGHEAIQRLRELTVAVPMAYAPLSRRERECLQWAAAGKTDWEIGHILGLSEKTVNVYIERVKAKYSANTRARAIALAMRDGIIAA